MWRASVWLCGALLGALLPVKVRAQTVNSQTQVVIDQTLQWSIARPTVADDGQYINCSYPAANCQPFNRAACDSTAPFRASVGRKQQGAVIAAGSTGSYAFAWFQPNTGRCINQANVANGGTVIPLPGGNPDGKGLRYLDSSSQFLGGVNAIDLPRSFVTGEQDITVGQIARALGLCDTEIALTRYTLCVGIDVTADGSINGINDVGNNNTGVSGTTSGSDIVTYFQFPVASKAPPPPTSISAKSLVSRVRLDVSVDNSRQDVYGFRVLYTDDPSDIALTDPDGPGYDASKSCGDWAHAQVSGTQGIASQASAGSLDVGGTNNTLYAYCAQTIDLMGNISKPTSAVTSYPHPECGLFDCWPEDVPVSGGYCGASSAGCGFLAALAVVLWRRGRRGIARWRGARLVGPIAVALLGVPRGASALPRGVELHFPTYGTELRVGLYRPVLSQNSSVGAVRDLVYGDSRKFFRRAPQYSLEFDYYFINEGIGLLGAYGRTGFWRDSGRSRKCINPDIPDKDPGHIVPCTSSTVASSEPGDDVTVFNIVPASMGVVYRYDLLRRNLDFPLVFSAKAGLDYHFWWSTVGSAVPRMPGGSRAQGGILGASASVSVGLALDYFSTRRGTYGDNPRSQYNYLFVEYMFLHGRYLFNSKPLIDLSDPTVVLVGLSLDMP